jgi:hypothetical protein
MNYQDLLDHLDSESCKLENPAHPRGSICTNLINNKYTFVVRVDTLYPLTVVKMCHNLGISCPTAYEDDYEVYSLFEQRKKNGES